MKTLVVALHSKFIHSALAPWYLKASCGPECGEVSVAEHTINESQDSVMASLYMQKPDVLAFSCYIWNISIVLKLAANLKKVLPEMIVILGGPEVSYDADNLLREHLSIDFILAGEGEQAFPQLLERINNGALIKNAMGIYEEMAAAHPIRGLCWRSENGLSIDVPQFVKELDSIPTPYTDEMLMSLNNKIAYYETSRGCPFSCSYCLSSVSAGVRFFSIERVFAELDKLAASGVKQIKFVDRTFNANKERAHAIIEHILEGSTSYACNFHFEVGADLFDEDTIQLLERAPKGLIQIEAGVQTTNMQTLTAVCRKTDLNKLFANLARLKQSGNIHIHADLIAGLPYEDFTSFMDSFNKTYRIKTNQLQLGFLKFLKGTRLREQALELGYTYREEPTYEVLAGRHISFDELILLKGIAELVEKYYNSGRFVYSTEYLITCCFTSYFDFYKSLYDFQKSAGLLENHSSVKELFSILDQFSDLKMTKKDRSIFRELLRLDYLSSDNSGTLPDFLKRQILPGFQDRCFEYLRNNEAISAIIPEAAGISSKQLFKRVHFEPFHPAILRILANGENEAVSTRLFIQKNDGIIPLEKNYEDTVILLFDYMHRDVITGRFPFYQIISFPHNPD